MTALYEVRYGFKKSCPSCNPVKKPRYGSCCAFVSFGSFVGYCVSNSMYFAVKNRRAIKRLTLCAASFWFRATTLRRNDGVVRSVVASWREIIYAMLLWAFVFQNLWLKPQRCYFCHRSYRAYRDPSLDRTMAYRYSSTKTPFLKMFFLKMPSSW